jgi:hypothetical protein
MFPHSHGNISFLFFTKGEKKCKEIKRELFTEGEMPVIGHSLEV